MATRNTGGHDGASGDRDVLRPIKFRARCSAPPAAVYGLLADLGSHLVWGGERQSAGFRLLALEAPPGAATVGTEFRSTGADGKHRVNHDRSVVTEAAEPSVFEFVTESRCLGSDGGLLTAGTYVHRFEISPAGSGSEVSYSMHTSRLEPVPAILRAPVISGLVQRILASMFRRGVRNLLAMAEEATDRAVA